MMKEVHIYMCVHIASIKSTAGNKTRFFPSAFLISTRSFLILAEGFRKDYVAACSTTFRSASEKNEFGGYVTVSCRSKMTQRSRTVVWPKFQWRHQIGYDGTHTEQFFTFKVTLCNNSCSSYCKFV